jgi:hypothetical protein
MRTTGTSAGSSGSRKTWSMPAPSARGRLPDQGVVDGRAVALGLRRAERPDLDLQIGLVLLQRGGPEIGAVEVGLEQQLCHGAAA